MALPSHRLKHGPQGELDEVTQRGIVVADKPLKYRLAYTADLEATFTPVFKLMLDNDATLFAPGDDRVASLFLWHFVEEVEHRSSALIIYDAVVDGPWYRMRMAPSIFKHVIDMMRLASQGFNKHVRWRSARSTPCRRSGSPAAKKHYCNDFHSSTRPTTARSATLSAICPCASNSSRCPGSYAARSRAMTVARGAARAADEWFARYDAGADVTPLVHQSHRAGR